MAKYIDIANDLKQRILSDEFIDKNKLPTEDHLIESYQVSRNTIRNAIKILISEGLLYPVQGSGMFIRNTKREGTVLLRSTRGVTNDHVGHHVQTKVISLELIEADVELANRLLCDIGTPVYYIIRLRYVDDKPYAIEYTYYNKNIIPYLGKEIAEQSIYNYIRNDLKLSIGFADKYIYAEKLNKQDSEYLDLNENDPGLVINDNVYLSNGIIFNTSKIIYNYTMTNFFAIAD